MISGLVKDNKGHFLKEASITLKKSLDSSIVKIEISDTTGGFTFNNAPKGKYFLTSSHIGYLSLNSDTFSINESDNIKLPDMILLEKSQGLKEVVVIARKPIIEVKADRIILNVEGTINENGQNALELLRKSPGVTIDQSSIISLNGKSGVQIYIDDKPSPLTDNDLTIFLSTIQASGINSIEIISNPSAKYDASGSAGIINIRLKKNQLYGVNGSASVGYNVGIYSKYNAAFSLNYRNKSFNIYSNYNFNDGTYAVNATQYRQILDTEFNQTIVNKSLNRAHNFKAGVDYTIDSKQTIGIMANGSLLDNTLYSNSSNLIGNFPSGDIDKILVANNRNIGERHNINTNINYHFADTLGHELSLDANYGLYHINSNQYQPNYYFDPSGDSLLFNIYNLISPTDINIYNTKADYEMNVGKGRLGVGVKFSYVTSTNKFREFNVFPSGAQADSTYTNDFNYFENINAFYINYNKTYKSFKIQAGIRVENSNISGNSLGYKNLDSAFLPYDSSFNLHYTNIFPSAAITLNKNPDKQWALTYSYRIDRPAYRDLNPFEFKIDDYTSRKGNTRLQPQFTNSIGLSFLFHQSLTTTLNYSYIKDVFTILFDTTNSSKTFITKENMSSQQIVNLNLSYPFQYKWYTLFGNITTYYTQYYSNFGPGKTINLNAIVFDANIDQTFLLGKTWTGQLTSYYTSPSIVQGSFKIKEQWNIDAGLQKTVLNKVGKVSITVTDIFNTSRFRGMSSFEGQEVISYSKEETRQLRIFFTYRFGNKKVKAARQRQTGVEDEKSRSF
jgi:hypothetical protein